MKYMYKKVFRFILIFKKLEIGRGRVETGRRLSHTVNKNNLKCVINLLRIMLLLL